MGWDGMYGGSMMWGGGLIWLLVLVALALGIAALIKYLAELIDCTTSATMVRVALLFTGLAAGLDRPRPRFGRALGYWRVWT